jgi:hypothetical protein
MFGAGNGIRIRISGLASQCSDQLSYARICSGDFDMHILFSRITEHRSAFLTHQRR